MIIAFTGHRPDKLGGYGDAGGHVRAGLRSALRNLLIELQPEKCISGMALGFDQLAAQVCVELCIPWIAAVPCQGQELVWPIESQRAYRELIQQASVIVPTAVGSYTPAKMQTRNIWMVDHADEIIACWDGTKGGTYNCAKYAESKGKKIHRIDPHDFF